MAALSITELQSLRDALIRARLAGITEVEDQNGERVRYASLDAMGRAISDVESRIAAMQSAAPNTIRFNVSKGT